MVYTPFCCNYLGGFLHLVSNVNFAELFEKAEHGELQFLVPSLREPRICQVHQLQNATIQYKRTRMIRASTFIFLKTKTNHHHRACICNNKDVWRNISVNSHRHTSSPSMASCSSVLAKETLPPITAPIMYTNHVKRPEHTTVTRFFRRLPIFIV